MKKIIITLIAVFSINMAYSQLNDLPPRPKTQYTDTDLAYLKTFDTRTNQFYVSKTFQDLINNLQIKPNLFGFSLGGPRIDVYFSTIFSYTYGDFYSNNAIWFIVSWETPVKSSEADSTIGSNRQPFTDVAKNYFANMKIKEITVCRVSDMIGAPPNNNSGSGSSGNSDIDHLDPNLPPP